MGGTAASGWVGGSAPGPGPVALPVLDLSGLPAPDREREAERQIALEADRPFNLALKGPSQFAYHLVSPRATADRPLVKVFRKWVLAEVAGTGSEPPR